jgi:hypothetical protein
LPFMATRGFPRWRVVIGIDDSRAPIATLTALDASMTLAKRLHWLDFKTHGSDRLFSKFSAGMVPEDE